MRLGLTNEQATKDASLGGGTTTQSMAKGEILVTKIHLESWLMALYGLASLCVLSVTPILVAGERVGQP